MYNKPILAVILVLALVTLACGINIDLPRTDVKTGTTQTKDIRVPEFDNPQTIADVELSFAGGELNLGSGAQGALIDGVATYNVADFEPEVDVSGNNVHVSQGDLEITGIPNFNERVVNRWELQLSDAPMNLTIKAGAYDGEYQLGGLALHSLKISDGAARVDLSFTEQNPVSMDTFQYTTGASDVTLDGLAYANFKDMLFRSGAGSYQLDFSGGLLQDATVEIESGISRITLIVPSDTNAEVQFQGGLTDVRTTGVWLVSGDTYSLNGSGPKLTIIVKMGAGSLELRSTGN